MLLLLNICLSAGHIWTNDQDIINSCSSFPTWNTLLQIWLPQWPCWELVIKLTVNYHHSRHTTLRGEQGKSRQIWDFRMLTAFTRPVWSCSLSTRKSKISLTLPVGMVHPIRLLDPNWSLRPDAFLDSISFMKIWQGSSFYVSLWALLT